MGIVSLQGGGLLNLMTLFRLCSPSVKLGLNVFESEVTFLASLKSEYKEKAFVDVCILYFVITWITWIYHRRWSTFNSWVPYSRRCLC